MERTIYPIGIQTFSEIRTKGMKYVDKTGYVYQLVNSFKYVFLNRPRRFGKSLLASTLKSYFEADRELFRGLAIDSLETEWTHHPVLYFDMSTAKHMNTEGLLSELNRKLLGYERIYGRKEGDDAPNQRLQGLIESAHAQTGQQAVVIIDEYDAPLLDVVHEAENLEKLRQTMRNFYSPLKACDPHLRFVFITGITKFSQLSIFSELNNLKNISMLPQYSGICGITREELFTQFTAEVGAMAEANGTTTDEMFEKLRIHYDGYHFCKKSEDVFNPFSIVNALSDRDLKAYWFESGTPTFLIKMLQHFRTDITALDGTTASEQSFDAPTEKMRNALPLLYQSGYLTIKGYDPTTEMYTLGIPNQEVRTGVYGALVPYYMGDENELETFSMVSRLFVALRADHMDEVLEELKVFFAAIPHDLENKTEKHYQTIFYIIFTLLGKFIQTEVKSAIGRADAVLKTATHIYVIEMKLDRTADEALAQIDAKGYLIPYTLDGRKLVKVGISFDTATRTLGDWKIVEEE